MPNFNNNHFKQILQEFCNVKKRILQKRPLSKNSSKINEYTELLIERYNAILEYTEIHLNDLSEKNKSKIFNKIIYCRNILKKCFEKINCNTKIPEEVNLLVRIDRSAMIKSKVEDFENLNSEIEQIKMATIEHKKSFITMCASIIRDNYDGNPLTLQSFLDKIDLIEDLTEPNLQATFTNFIKSKLDAKAREVLPDNVSTIDDIKTALRNGIKLENSKIIAGKIAALNVGNGNFSDFTKQVEELADSLKRALVMEGITKSKAHEMVIEQTVSVCRLNAKSTLVKSILASSVFKDPREVVAKLIVEETTEMKEQQVLAVRNNGNRNRNNQFNQYRNNSYRGNNSTHFHGNSYRGNNRVNYPRTDNTFNNNNQFQNNYRGNARNNFPNNNNNSRASVRSLNVEAPQQSLLREEEEEILTNL